jgi:hypothetical protein
MVVHHQSALQREHTAFVKRNVNKMPGRTPQTRMKQVNVEWNHKKHQHPKKKAKKAHKKGKGAVGRSTVVW